MADALNLVDAGLEAVPADVALVHADVETVNLSENAIRPPGGLSSFRRVRTLILDKNGLESLEGFPRMPTVTTLWLNNNGFAELAALLDEVAACFPSVTFLSLMRNPAAPPLVCLSEEDAAAAQRYRLYTIWRLPKLEFLDSAPVTAEERAEAAVKGQFLVVRKPKARVSSGGGAAAAAAAAASSGSVFGAFAAAGSSGSAASSPVVARAGDGSTSPAVAPGAGAGAGAGEADRRKPSAFLGLGSTHYDGRHSEGNRFISDRDL